MKLLPIYVYCFFFSWLYGRLVQYWPLLEWSVGQKISRGKDTALYVQYPVHFVAVQWGCAQSSVRTSSGVFDQPWQSMPWWSWLCAQKHCYAGTVSGHLVKWREIVILQHSETSCVIVYFDPWGTISRKTHHICTVEWSSNPDS